MFINLLAVLAAEKSRYFELLHKRAKNLSVGYWDAGRTAPELEHRRAGHHMPWGWMIFLLFRACLQLSTGEHTTTAGEGLS